MYPRVTKYKACIDISLCDATMVDGDGHGDDPHTIASNDCHVYVSGYKLVNAGAVDGTAK